MNAIYHLYMWVNGVTSWNTFLPYRRYTARPCLNAHTPSSFFPPLSLKVLFYRTIYDKLPLQFDTESLEAFRKALNHDHSLVLRTPGPPKALL